VDASGYLLLSRIYTSNMTGNTIEFALRAVDSRWGEAFQRAWPVLMFVCGLLLSAIITEALLRRDILSFSAVPLAIEAALILAFIPLGLPAFRNGAIHVPSFWNFNLLVGLLAVAMGLQNQTISRVGALSFRTTHVTGTLTKMGADLSEYLFWLYDQIHAASLDHLPVILRASPQRREFRQFCTTFGLFAFFTLGAVCAILALRSWAVWSLIAPVSVLCVLIVVDLIRPIAASAEQSEMRNR
jgi:uncharacterized membrane protein YoaK (UPF0700 family)